MATSQLQMIPHHPNVNHSHGFLHNNVNTQFPTNFMQYPEETNQFHCMGSTEQQISPTPDGDQQSQHPNDHNQTRIPDTTSYNSLQPFRFNQYMNRNGPFHDPSLPFNPASYSIQPSAPNTIRHHMFNYKHVNNPNQGFGSYNQRYIPESYNQGKQNHNPRYQPFIHSPTLQHQYQAPSQQHNPHVNNYRISSHSPPLQSSSDEGMSSPNPVPTALPNTVVTKTCDSGRNNMENTMPISSNKDWELECMGVSIKLATRELWRKFENVNLEMVISKNGRRMFPPLEYDISGLEPTKFYNVFVDFVVVTDHIWKYCDHTWKPNGPAPPEEPSYHPVQRMYVHPQSPCNGEAWNKNRVYFRKMKLSNHLHNEREKIVTLRTLLKYQPRLHIVEVSPHNPAIQSNLRTYVLPKTKFITVTLYHDTDVAQLKINLNPFARSFREKPMNDNSDQESQPSPMSDLSPLTSPEEPGDNFYNRTDATKFDDVEYAPKQIVTMVNPAPPSDVSTARLFLENQRCAMSDLVAPDCPKVPRNDGNPPYSNSPYGHGTPREDNAANTSPTFEEFNKPKTVHHYAKEKADNNVLTARENAIDPKAPDLDDLQLLNVDRCFPPNQMAPFSQSLPFDPNLLKQGNNRSENLPVFYECSFYRQQAAENHNRQNQQKNYLQSNPVVYVPQRQTNSGFDPPRDDTNFHYGNESLGNDNPQAVSFSNVLLSNGNNQPTVTKSESTHDQRDHCESDNTTDVSNPTSSVNENGTSSNDTTPPSCESESTVDPTEATTNDVKQEIHYDSTQCTIPTNNCDFHNDLDPLADDKESLEDSSKEVTDAISNEPSSLSAQFFSSDLPTPSLAFLKQFFIDEPRNIELDGKKRKLEIDESDSYEWFAKRTCISAERL